jgi:hypothetical protein
MARGDRQRTSAELDVLVGSLYRRLRRALDQFDDGDTDATQDLAAYTRTLLAFGKGDRAIAHMARRHKLELPPVQVGGLPDVGGAHEIAIMNLPVNENGTGATARELSLDEWLGSTAVELAGGPRRITQWHQFITDWGNSFGAHVASTVPQSIEGIQVFQGPASDLASHALRSAAVVAERMLEGSLPQIGFDVQAVNRPYQAGGVEILSMAVGAEPPYFSGFGVRATGHGDIPVMAMPVKDGTICAATWHWDGVQPAGSIRLEFREPE